MDNRQTALAPLAAVRLPVPRRPPLPSAAYRLLGHFGLRRNGF